jgi:3-methyladenine DNA glycosylase AlkD
MNLPYLKALEKEFKRNENSLIASQQKSYLKGLFDFYGIKTPIRREIQKSFFVKEYLPSKEEAHQIIKLLWQKQKREFHYFGQELAKKYIKNCTIKDIELFEYMITQNSWWDTVDFIAVHLVGEYFKCFPKKKDKKITEWLGSNSMWLNRTAIIFQLKHKDNIDTNILTTVIKANLGSKEFFIKKAIGWMLREYTKTNPNWVINFVKKNELSNLSKKEALRLINS